MSITRVGTGSDFELLRGGGCSSIDVSCVYNANTIDNYCVQCVFYKLHTHVYLLCTVIKICLVTTTNLWSEKNLICSSSDTNSHDLNAPDT